MSQIDKQRLNDYADYLIQYEIKCYDDLEGTHEGLTRGYKFLGLIIKTLSDEDAEEFVIHNLRLTEFTQDFANTMIKSNSDDMKEAILTLQRGAWLKPFAKQLIDKHLEERMELLKGLEQGNYDEEC